MADITNQLQAAAGTAAAGGGVAYTLYAMGSNNFGDLGNGKAQNKTNYTQLGSLTTWASLGKGRPPGYQFGIKTDGTLWAWGVNGNGSLGVNNTQVYSSPVQVGALTNWSKVSSGNGNILAIKTDGTLWAWGAGTFGQLGDNAAISRSSPIQVGALTTWTEAANGSQSCWAIKNDGTLWAWGRNGGTGSGTLGTNNLITYSSPVQIGSLTNWSTNISASSYHCAAIKTDGTLWTWGWGVNGGLGQNNTTDYSSPVQVGALTDWSKVSCADFLTVAVKTNGTLWAWGSNGTGQLGDNTTITRSSPVQIGALTDWSDVAVNDNSVLALKNNGTIWAWGFNNLGQLGIGTVEFKSSPVQVGTDSNWSKIGAASNNAHYAIKTTGSYWVVGSWQAGNIGGQLGLGDTDRVSSPVQIGNALEWSFVSSDANNSAGIKTDGSLWAWGTPTNGRLGTNDIIQPYSSPVQVGTLTNWKQVSVGNAYMVAVKTDGTLWSWGSGNNGRLGQNNTTNYSSPTQVGSLTDWDFISAGNDGAWSAVKSNGTLWSCGRNTYAQIGDGTFTTKSSPVQVGALTDWKQVSVGSTFTMAVKTNGTLWGWGQNGSGMLGTNSTTSYSSPVQIGALTNWSYVSCGSNSTMAIKTDGTLWGWGLNTSGQLGDGTATTRSSPVQIGALTDWLFINMTGNSGFGVRGNGTLWSWGANNDGILGLNNLTNRSSPTQIGALTTWADVGYNKTIQANCSFAFST
jgi:alpha-tubulin suppressor-like RCC1 family protein